jgi:hypothetical protein
MGKGVERAKKRLEEAQALSGGEKLREERPKFINFSL